MKFPQVEILPKELKKKKFFKKIIPKDIVLFWLSGISQWSLIKGETLEIIGPSAAHNTAPA